MPPKPATNALITALEPSGHAVHMDEKVKPSYSYEQLRHFFKFTSWDQTLKDTLGLQLSSWDELKAAIQDLEQQCAKKECIRVVFIARHGQGAHNVILEEGKAYMLDNTPDDCDSMLTDLGRTQALQAASALRQEQAKGMPMPQKWFTSPFRRCGETCGLEWGWNFGHSKSKAKEGVLAVKELDGTFDETDANAGANKDLGHGVPAIVVENLREILHVWQCNARLPKSQVQNLFPSFDWPDDTKMTEEDTMWKAASLDLASMMPAAVTLEPGKKFDGDALWAIAKADGGEMEAEEELVKRAGRGFSECLEKSKGLTYISLTAHNSILRGLTTYLGLGACRLEVGEIRILVLRIREEEEDKWREGGAAAVTPSNETKASETGAKVPLGIESMM